MVLGGGLRKRIRNTRLYMYTLGGWFEKEYPDPLRDRGYPWFISKYAPSEVGAAPISVTTLHTVYKEYIRKYKQLATETLPKEKSTRTARQQQNPNQRMEWIWPRQWWSVHLVIWRCLCAFIFGYWTLPGSQTMSHQAQGHKACLPWLRKCGVDSRLFSP